MSSIIRISDAATLALHAMTTIAEAKGELVTMKAIAKRYRVSQNHLSKVLQRLVKAKLIESIKGNGGGFKLTKKPKQISFLNIYEAIDGKLEVKDCLLHDKQTCPKCILKGFIKEKNQEAEEFFKQKKLSDFV